MLNAGANICICPLTEGYLGDGISPLSKLASEASKQAEGQLSIGTDCNNRLCMAEEMRWMMYGQQVKSKNTKANCVSHF